MPHPVKRPAERRRIFEMITFRKSWWPCCGHVVAGGESEKVREVGGIGKAVHLTSRIMKRFLTGPQGELEQYFLQLEVLENLC